MFLQVSTQQCCRDCLAYVFCVSLYMMNSMCLLVELCLLIFVTYDFPAQTSMRMLLRERAVTVN